MSDSQEPRISGDRQLPNSIRAYPYLVEAAEVWRNARDWERDRMTVLTEHIRKAVQGGATEAQVARLTGLHRKTVRRALGKP